MGVPYSHSLAPDRCSSWGNRVSSSFFFVRSRYLEETCCRSPFVSTSTTRIIIQSTLEITYMDLVRLNLLPIRQTRSACVHHQLPSFVKVFENECEDTSRKTELTIPCAEFHTTNFKILTVAEPCGSSFLMAHLDPCVLRLCRGGKEMIGKGSLHRHTLTLLFHWRERQGNARKT